MVLGQREKHGKPCGMMADMSQRHILGPFGAHCVVSRGRATVEVPKAGVRRTKTSMVRKPVSQPEPCLYLAKYIRASLRTAGPA